VLNVARSAKREKLVVIAASRGITNAINQKVVLVTGNSVRNFSYKVVRLGN
jgi:hypothetical protein